MRSFPLPVRVAAGLAGTVVEQTRRLPDHLIGLPVTVTSQALQLSMRVQQHITELAIKGDDLLAGVRQPEQHPEWATFDEDEPPTAPERSRSERQATASDSETDRFVAHPPPEHEWSGEEAPEDVSDLLPGYEEMTLPQLRGKLRGLSESDLVRLLEHERAHSRRPDFLQMLFNRLNNVRAAAERDG
ncbi:lipid droplet-associated protein [Actinopolyspora sp. H202]|uniref:lipid droplet-associated protein n=1 Tax=Actinopolyspora sp. H202 TaxID=1500456 RepID=UPI003EE5E2FD